MDDSPLLSFTLARFSQEVRESTLSRFRQVKHDDWSWTPAPGLLSFADVLKHLFDADHWLLDLLDGGPLSEGVVITPGDADAQHSPSLLDQLARLGPEKSHRISRLTNDDFHHRRFNLNRRGVHNLSNSSSASAAIPLSAIPVLYIMTLILRAPLQGWGGRGWHEHQ